MGPFLARIRDIRDNRQEARHERRQECHSTKHIPTDTPLADEKIPNTNRAEMQQQFLTRGADTGPTQPPKVTDSNTLKVEELREKEPVRMNELPSRLDPAHEQEVRGQPELPKIKTEKAIFDERLKEMEQKMAALEKKLNEENKKLTVINHSLLQENIDLKIRLNALEQPAASIPATNTPALVNEVNKATEKQKEQTMYRQNQKMADNKAAELEAASIAASQKELIAKIKGTGEIDWNKLGKGYEEFIAGGMKVTPGYSPPWRPASYFANNANLKQDSNSEVFKKFFENAQKISGSKLAMDSPDGLTWIKKIIDVESQTIYPVKNLDRPKNMQISEE